MNNNELENQSHLTELEAKIQALEKRIEELEEFKRKNEGKLNFL